MNLFLTPFFGRRIMPTERQLFRDGEIAIDALPPQVKSSTLEDGKKVSFYVKETKIIIELGFETFFSLSESFFS